MRILTLFLAAAAILSTLTACPPSLEEPSTTVINEGDTYVDVYIYGDDDSADEENPSDDDSAEKETCEFEIILSEEIGEWPHCQGPLTQIDEVEDGNLIQSVLLDAIYYFASPRRYTFPNGTTFASWYGEDACPTCESVGELTDAELAAIELGGNVTIKPGSRIVVIESDTTLYVVDACKTLRPVTPAVARDIYGDNWNELITIVPDFFFVDYSIGDYVPSESDYNLAAAQSRTLPEELTCWNVPAPAPLLEIYPLGPESNTWQIPSGEWESALDSQVLDLEFYAPTIDLTIVHQEVAIGGLFNPATTGSQFSDVYITDLNFGGYDDGEQMTGYAQEGYAFDDNVVIPAGESRYLQFWVELDSETELEPGNTVWGAYNLGAIKVYDPAGNTLSLDQIYPETDIFGAVMTIGN